MIIKKYFEPVVNVTNAELYDIFVNRISDEERDREGFRQYMDISDYVRYSMVYKYQGGSFDSVQFFDFGAVPIEVKCRAEKENEIKERLEALLKMSLTEVLKISQANVA